MATRDHLGGAGAAPPGAGGAAQTGPGAAAAAGAMSSAAVPGGAGGPQQQHHHGGPSARGGRAAAGDPLGGPGGQQRSSRRDQLSRDPGIGGRPGPGGAGAVGPAGGGGYGPGGGSGFVGGGPARGSPGGPGRRAAGAGRGSKSYANSPSGQYPDDYRNVPQSISASAFNVGSGAYGGRDANVIAGGAGGAIGVGGIDPMMDRTMGDPRMDRGMDRGMDHHRSTSMPAGPAGMHGRSRSASRGLPGNRGPGYHSLDREGYNDRDFMPIREPRERSLDRDWTMGGTGGYGGVAGGGVPYGRRDRSLDRRDPMLDVDDGMGYGRDPMAARRTGLSPNPVPTTLGRGGDPFLNELQHNNAELQRELANLKKELEVTNQKLGSSMHSIKTFWSPELKKERALRKEESAKYSLINDQLKLLNSENQVGLIIPRFSFLRILCCCY